MKRTEYTGTCPKYPTGRSKKYLVAIIPGNERKALGEEAEYFISVEDSECQPYMNHSYWLKVFPASGKDKFITEDFELYPWDYPMDYSSGLALQSGGKVILLETEDEFEEFKPSDLNIS